MLTIRFEVKNRLSDVCIDERIEERKPESSEEETSPQWATENLFEDHKDVSFEISATNVPDDDPDDEYPPIRLSVDSFHAENKETGRAFHLNIDIPLTRADLENLKVFAETALAIGSGFL